MNATLSTTLGYLKTLLGKYTPLAIGKKHLQGIYNYRNYHSNLATSGQPTEDQFSLIKQAGFKTVINLAPHHAENALRDEASTLERLGLYYIHIPVDFRKPSEQNFTDFVAHYSAVKHQKTWIHCAANMRVSAFLYRYRRDIEGIPEPEAAAMMATVWQPFGAWRGFLKPGS